MPHPTVSLVVVAKEAGRYLPPLFADILAQDYPSKCVELLLVAAPSQDDTLEYLRQFSIEHPERSVVVLENLKGTLSAGWNVALSHATGDVILRVDAHTRFGASFVSRSVEAIENGENIAGGRRKAILPPQSGRRLLAIAEASKFGCGVADYRNACQPGYVDTLAHAAYRRSVFRNVGGFDERLVRNQDNEIHFRMKQAGYQFYYSPTVESMHHVRDGVVSLLRQKYNAGLWIGLALGIQPRCFRPRHFIPAVFTVAIVAGVVAGIIWSWLSLITILSSYSLPAIGYALREVMLPEARGCWRLCILLPFIFLLIHLSYGLGTVVGLLKMPAFYWRTRGYVVPRPVQ